jgi:hypothetical protein
MRKQKKGVAFSTNKEMKYVQKEGGSDSIGTSLENL